MTISHTKRRIMKKKTTRAILFTTSMMLALIGCKNASGNTSSSSDNAPVAEADADTNSESSDEAETYENDEESSTESDSSSADSSSATATSDDSFEINGKKISILDDTQATLDIFNTLFPDEKQELVSSTGDQGLSFYGYDTAPDLKSQFTITTFESFNSQLLGNITVTKPGFTTPKGICIGTSTADDVVAAYSDSAEISSGKTVVSCKFNNFYLDFAIKDNKVEKIDYFTTNYLLAYGLIDSE